jgi:hypothetical protein
MRCAAHQAQPKLKAKLDREHDERMKREHDSRWFLRFVFSSEQRPSNASPNANANQRSFPVLRFNHWSECLMRAMCVSRTSREKAEKTKVKSRRVGSR